MKIQKDQAFKIGPEVLFQQVSGEVVLLDMASENYFGLDEVGTRIWSLIESGNNVDGIVDTLCQEYEVERDILEGDVMELVSKLIDSGLVSPVPGGQAI